MVGREAATTAKAIAFSFEPLRICSSFQAANLSSRSLTRHTYLAFLCFILSVYLSDDHLGVTLYDDIFLGYGDCEVYTS